MKFLTAVTTTQLNITDTNSLSLIDNGTYRTIQSLNNTPLVLNPAGNNVGVLNTSPSAALDTPGSTTARSGFRVRSGTAPTTPNDGDIWYDGVHLRFRLGGYTYQLDQQTVYNVKDYGAKGDGVTDDSAVISNVYAIAGEAGGGVVFLPQGNYILNNIVYQRYGNVTIMGAGRGATVVTCNFVDNNNGLFTFQTTQTANQYNITWKDLTINMNNKQTCGILIRGTGIVGQMEQNFVLDNVEFYGWAAEPTGGGFIAPLAIRGSGFNQPGLVDQLTVRNCYFHDGYPTTSINAVGDSVTIHSDSLTNVLFENTIFRNTYSSTVAVSSDVIGYSSAVWPKYRNWRFVNCSFINTIQNYFGTLVGDIDDSSRTGFDSLTVEGCYFEGGAFQTQYDIRNFHIQNGRNIIIKGNKFKNGRTILGLGYSTPVGNEDMNLSFSDNVVDSYYEVADADGVYSAIYADNDFYNVQQPGVLGGYGRHNPSKFNGNLVYNCGYVASGAGTRANSLVSFGTAQSGVNGGNVVENNTFYNDRPTVALNFIFGETYNANNLNTLPNIYQNNTIVGYGSIPTFGLNSTYSQHIIKGNSGVTEDTIMNRISTTSDSILTTPTVLNPTDVCENNHTLSGSLTNAVYQLGSTSGTITADPQNGEVQPITATGNITFVIPTGTKYGKRLRLEVIQDVTGSRTVTLPANVKVAGGVWTPSSAANSLDWLELMWEGSGYWCEIARSMSLSAPNPESGHPISVGMFAVGFN